MLRRENGGLILELCYLIEHMQSSSYGMLGVTYQKYDFCKRGMKIKIEHSAGTCYVTIIRHASNVCNDL